MDYATQAARNLYILKIKVFKNKLPQTLFWLQLAFINLLYVSYLVGSANIIRNNTTMDIYVLVLF